MAWHASKSSEIIHLAVSLSNAYPKCNLHNWYYPKTIKYVAWTAFLEPGFMLCHIYRIFVFQIKSGTEKNSQHIPSMNEVFVDGLPATLMGPDSDGLRCQPNCTKGAVVFMGVTIQSAVSPTTSHRLLDKNGSLSTVPSRCYSPHYNKQAGQYQ